MTTSGPLRTVTIEERRARLALRHRLAPSARTDDDVAAITDALVALHSSDPVSVYLSATARMAHPSLEAVDAALYEQRSVIRFHAMRRTLWVTTRDVARAAHASSTLKLLAPEHARFVKLLAANGIPDGDRWIADAKEQTLAELHRRGEATARELGQAVPALRHPIVLAPGKSYASTQGAHTRVLQHLGFDGSIVRSRPVGSWVNSQYRWASMADWITGGITGMDPSEASAALVDRWLHRFGPATTADVQWWTGWNLRDTRQAIAAAGAVPVEVGVAPGRVESGWLAADDTEPVSCDEAWVALVPGLDPTTMGWKLRDWYLDPDDSQRLFDPNGNGGPAIWIDGRIVGSWVPRPDGTIALGWFEAVAARRRRQVESVARSLEELVDRTFTVRFPASIQSILLGS